MNLAIDQAKLGGIETFQNPQVGAVLVKNDQILAKGYHHFFGGDHAEVDVLKQVTKDQSQGATLFVTLEPCSHFGKTPPCSHRIVEAGIKKVVIGQLDPHPVVAGKGRDYLIQHGITVISDVLKTQVVQLNPHYNFFYRHQRPWVTLKIAMTMDGKINQKDNHRTIISNQNSYLDSQKIRANHQAILIGERTLEIDDPQLTVRTIKMEHPPVRLVVLKDATNALGKRLLQNKTLETWLLVKHPAPKNFPNLSPNVHILAGNWTPQEIVEFCYQNGWQSLLVEGGSKLQAQFINAHLVEEWISYIAPRIFGGNSLPAAFDRTKLGQDLQFAQPQVEFLNGDLKLQALRKEDQ